MLGQQIGSDTRLTLRLGHKFDDLTRPEQPYQVTNPPGQIQSSSVKELFLNVPVIKLIK